MATTIQGTGGAASCDSFGAKLSVWSANFDFGLLDTTGFGDAGFRTAEPTLMSVSGSASGQCITETAPLLTTVVAANTFVPSVVKGTVTLTIATGKTYTFPAVFSNILVTRAEDGPATVTFDFRSNGVIAVAWA